MKKQISVRRKKSLSAVKIFAVILTIILTVLAALQGGFSYLHATHKTYSPDYKMQDISTVLIKNFLSEDDYNLLFAQTGLTKIAVDDFLKNGDTQSILSAQSDFFGNYKTQHDLFAPFTCCHKVEEDITVAPLQKGDIIITLTTHFSGFMLGHAVIVTDPLFGETATSVGYMSKSFKGDISAAVNRTSFVVLRYKDSDVAAAAAEYAESNLLDLPYSISVGLTSPKFPEKPDRTQCGHLVWYAYKTQGVDIDSNGGPFVYPRDILDSEHLEVVQVFGMDTQEVKSK